MTAVELFVVGFPHLCVLYVYYDLTRLLFGKDLEKVSLAVFNSDIFIQDTLPLSTIL